MTPSGLDASGPLCSEVPSSPETTGGAGKHTQRPCRLGSMRSARSRVLLFDEGSIATTDRVAPPAADCNAATAGTVNEVPYTADYYFWKRAA